jgi:DNA sulfur modification protein DndB
MDVEGLLGRCGDREVFTGFAPAAELVSLSFADVLDESTGRGYQRRFTREHSLEFKRYIQTPGATSIPLTFNLRAGSASWRLERGGRNTATLHVDSGSGPVFSQVDGQHRLGFLQRSPVEFAFMTFLGMTVEEEMEVFRTINGKAKGLSSSLLDFTEARLLGEDLPRANPDLYVALRLHEDPASPWYKRLDLGGERTMGMKRTASLRTMQMAVKRLVRAAQWEQPPHANDIAAFAMDFWRAVAFVLPEQWAAPRRHMLVKGIGVYALMSMAGLFVREGIDSNTRVDFDYFVGRLSDFVDQVDWGNEGPLHGFGGGAGADAAFQMLMQVRSAAYDRFRTHA